MEWGAWKFEIVGEMGMGMLARVCDFSFSERGGG